MVMVNKIMHYHTSLPRLLLSSTLGAIWSVIAICIPDEYRLFVNWCTYLIITGLMLMIINSPLNIIKGSSGKINWFAIRSYIKDLLKGVAVISWRCDTFTRVLYICWLCNKEYNDKQQAVGYICSRGVSYAHHTGTKQREAQ